MSATLNTFVTGDHIKLQWYLLRAANGYGDVYTDKLWYLFARIVWISDMSNESNKIFALIMQVVGKNNSLTTIWLFIKICTSAYC